MRRLLLLILPLTLLSGCLNAWHGNYSCKGYPEGVKCNSIRENYDLTNYKDALTNEDNQRHNSGNNPGGNPGMIEPVSAEGAPVRGMGYSGPMPLRTQARIIRIWVAPWESQEGQLHLPNYIYAEVEKRQWSIGEGKLKVAPRITPLEPISPPEKGRAPSQPGPTRQSRQRVAQKKSTEKPLFPEQLQRPKGQNQEELKRFQEQLIRQQQTQGGRSEIY